MPLDWNAAAAADTASKAIARPDDQVSQTAPDHLHSSSATLRRRTRSRAMPDAAPTAGPRFGDLSLDVEEVRLDRIKIYKKNARTHSARQITQLAASIRAFGFVNPVVLDAGNVLVAGHGRLAAARELGLAAVPAIRLSHLDEAALQALRIADNRLAELAGWDEELLATELGELSLLDLDFSLEITGFSSGEIDILLDGRTEPAKVDPADEVAGPAAVAISRPGDLWRLGRHRLICGSVLDPAVLVTLLEGESVRTVFTDPPYNVPVNGHVCGLGKIQHREFAMASGEMSESQFTAFLQTSIGNMTARLVNGGLAFVCMDWRHLLELQLAARGCELTTVNLCVWAKDNGGMGSFYRSQHELVLVLKAGDAPHRNLVELGRHGRYRTNVWSYAGVNTMKAGRLDELAMHPTVKPVALVADALRDCTRRGEWVLDGFAGSGTTLIAAERSGRRAAGIEIDPLYVDVAIRRWQTLTGEAAVLAGTGESFAEVEATRLEEASHA